MAKFSAILLVAIALVNCGALAQVIPDQYIVKLKSETDLKSMNKWLTSTMRRVEASRPEFRSFSEKLMHTYDINGNYKGYAGKFSKEMLEELKNNPNVVAIEQDAVVKLYDEPSQQEGATWGLSRVSQRTNPDLTKPYVYPTSAGEGVTAYVIDTGIKLDHPDFEGRAVFGFKAKPNYGEDGNGHGTHCAGTIGSKTWGVAKKVQLVSVKVLSDSGSGSYADVLAGINWVANDVKNGKKKNVANMSLGGPKNQQLNDAMEAAVAAGVNFAVAAGNENQDACKVSPASAKGVVSVAASDRTDKRASFSNWGAGCVDLFAPGVNIESTWNDGKTETISGTSMASPHVAGVLALIVAQNPNLSPAEIKSLLLSQTTLDVIKDTKNAPNKLAYVQTGKSTPQPTPTEPPTPTAVPTNPPTPTQTPNCPWWNPFC